MTSPSHARRRRIQWVRQAIVRAALALAALASGGMTTPLFAQDLEPAVADFWAAGPPEEIDAAVERILALDPGIEALWPLLRAGGAYDADVPRGRQVLTRRNPGGVEYRTIA